MPEHVFLRFLLARVRRRGYKGGFLFFWRGNRRSLHLFCSLLPCGGCSGVFLTLCMLLRSLVFGFYGPLLPRFFSYVASVMCLAVATHERSQFPLSVLSPPILSRIRVLRACALEPPSGSTGRFLTYFSH